MQRVVGAICIVWIATSIAGVEVDAQTATPNRPTSNVTGATTSPQSSTPPAAPVVRPPANVTGATALPQNSTGPAVPPATPTGAAGAEAGERIGDPQMLVEAQQLKTVSEQIQQSVAAAVSAMDKLDGNPATGQSAIAVRLDDILRTAQNAIELTSSGSVFRDRLTRFSTTLEQLEADVDRYAPNPEKAKLSREKLAQARQGLAEMTSGVESGNVVAKEAIIGIIGLKPWLLSEARLQTSQEVIEALRPVIEQMKSLSTILERIRKAALDPKPQLGG
jgi:hypothetical protein